MPPEPRFIQWARRTKRGHVPAAWQIVGDSRTEPHDDDIGSVHPLWTHGQWEYVTLPRGVHPDEGTVMREHDMGGEGG